MCIYIYIYIYIVVYSYSYMYVCMYARLRGNHLSSTTCLTQLFFEVANDVANNVANDVESPLLGGLAQHADKSKDAEVARLP